MVFTAVMLGTTAVSWLGRVPALSLLGAYSGELIALVFLGVAVVMAGKTGGVARHGISLGGLLGLTREEEDARAVLDEGDTSDPGALALVRAALPSALRETSVALAACMLIFPPFVLGYWLWWQPARPFVLTFPPELANVVLTQLVLVALPEEALFRGYVQTRLSDHWKPTGKLPVAVPTLVLQAALFALVHLPGSPHPARLAVFFPALVFGLLRAYRGGIGAALVFHAACNLLSETLARSWS